MAAALSSRVAAIERECRRLERLLASDESWNTLKLVIAAEARGEAQPGARAKLEAALEGNPLYRALRELHEAIAILSEPAPTAEPQAPAPGDQFTLIRGIDATTATRLAAAGVTRFADIARWRAADVKTMARKLGVAKRIAREGWIEQAAILASGGRTRFAARGQTSAPIAPEPDDTFVPDRRLAARLDAERSKAKPARRAAKPRSMMAALQRLERVDGGEGEAPSLGPDVMYDGDRRAAKERGDVPMPDHTAKRAPSTGPDTAPALGAARPLAEDIDDLADLPFHEMEEAEVMIVERPTTFTAEDEQAADTRRRAQPARAGSLDARLRRSNEPESLDALHYAGYQSTIDEAEVEIVRYDARAPGAEGSDDDASVASGMRRLGRLFKSLTGN